MVRFPTDTKLNDHFVLTADVDWASEDCIEAFLEMAAAAGIRPTLFVTHRSAAIARAADGGCVELGIHPNFLKGTTHGGTIDAIFRHLLELVPNPVGLRCHAFFDNSHVAMAAARHGITVDSNLVCHLQPGLHGLRHWNGVLRLPVFFEDDVHWLKGLGWRFGHHSGAFASPGLKILNVHPFMWALNADGAAFYATHKAHIPTLDRDTMETLRNPGPGCATFLADVIRWVRESGKRFVTFSEIATRVDRDLAHAA